MFFFTYLYMCCFFSFSIRMFLYVCNLYFCFTHDALIRKRLKTLGQRRAITKSLNKRSSVSVITIDALDILDLIAISG